MRNAKRAALYARVSTPNGHQDPDVQLQAIREVAARAGWEIVETYIDHGISGAKGRDKRPAFDRLLNDGTRRKFNLVAAWSVDRLGRSLQDLVAFLGDLKAAGCDLYLHVQALDTTTSAGKALFQMLGVFAEFERAIIQERVHAGLAKARAKGKKLGRPRLAPRLAAAIHARASKGEGKRAIGRALGVPVAAVSARLGHSSAAVTLGVYSHATTDAEAAAAQVAGLLLSNVLK
jgi:DNA invertase Pin-like site-specific DNA recombinase